MMRTELARRTGLERKTPMPRIGRLQVVQGRPEVVAALRPRPRRDTGFSAKVKLDVRKRAGNGCAADAHCEACGNWLGQLGGEVKRRKVLPGAGQSAVTDSATDGVLLCASPGEGCIHRSSSRNERLEAMGIWLRRGEDPASVPIQLHGWPEGGITLWLGADGSYQYEPPDPSRSSQP